MLENPNCHISMNVIMTAIRIPEKKTFCCIVWGMAAHSKVHGSQILSWGKRPGLHWQREVDLDRDEDVGFDSYVVRAVPT